MKFCVDCKWHRAPAFGDPFDPSRSNHLCENPLAELRSRVDGCALCVDERESQSAHACGHDARFYEEMPPAAVPAPTPTPAAGTAP
jgi:hypothetical protein